MSGKDESIFSKNALMGTKPGKQIIKQGLFKSKGFNLIIIKKKQKIHFLNLLKDLQKIYLIK
jgi:hypothetical protein